MRLSIFIAFTAGVISGVHTAHIAPKFPHDVPVPQVVAVNIKGERGSIPPNDRIKSYMESVLPTASDGVVENLVNPAAIRPVDLQNLYISYGAEVQIGTPPQDITVAIDTGSSDLWVISVDNPFCAKTGADIVKGWPNCTTNVFDATKSSTWKYNETNFHIGYGDYTYALGKWGTDTLNIGSINLPHSNLALGKQTNSSQGVFGIGYMGDESTLLTYKNIPILLRDAGYTDTISYSLYLNDADAATGQILFGGVDHDKYVPPLYTVPILPDYSMQISKMIVQVDSITYNDGQGRTKVAGEYLVALLDSGTTLTLLPSSAVLAIYEELGAKAIDDSPLYCVPCDVRKSKKTIDYNFSGAIIKVPISEILLNVEGSAGQPIFMETGELACGVGIVPSESTIILGDTFLRSAYVVYDLDSNEISLANTKFNSTSYSIEAITAKGVPGAIKAPLYA